MILHVLKRSRTLELGYPRGVILLVKCPFTYKHCQLRYYMTDKISKIEIYIATIIGIALVFGIVYLISNVIPGSHDEFAKCLSQNGVKFYGAFWCPHCKDQKELFGNSIKYVDYIECSTPDLKQIQTCIDANITGYPTWQFSDKRISAVLSLENISANSKCKLE